MNNPYAFRKPLLGVTLALAAASLSHQVLQAETVKWTSPSGTVWGEASSWTRTSDNGNVVPGATDDVIFDNTAVANLGSAITLRADRTINSLTFSLTTQTSTLLLRSSHNSGNYTLTLQSGQISREAGSGSALVRIGDTAGSGGNLSFATGASGYTLTNQSSNGQLELRGDITGSGKTVTKSGVGIVLYSGAIANTYTGLTTVEQGALRLGKSAGVNAIAGNVLVKNNAFLRLMENNQIADTAALELSNGRFETGGKSETLGTLTLSGAGNSRITFGTTGTGESLRFADSSSIAWTSGAVLDIWYWNEAAGGLFFGTDATGLTAGQQALIRLYSDNGQTLLGTAALGADGRIGLSGIPEPSTYALLTALAAVAIACLRRTRRRQSS